MVLNHITHVPFLPLLALSPAGSYLFYLFRLSTAAVLEVRRDFAAIYFMRVTSFSALSLPPIVGVPTLAISSQGLTLAMFLWSSTASDTHTLTHARARARTCGPYNDVFVSIAKAAPSVLFYTYFALIHPSRPLTPPTTVYRTG